MPSVLDSTTSPPQLCTTLVETTAQQTTFATHTLVPTDTTSTPLATQTDEPQSQTDSGGLDPQAKIALEVGIALGVLVLVVAIALCVYGFSCRKSDKDSDTFPSYVPEPGTPHASMLELPSQQYSGLGYEAITITHSDADIQTLPKVSQKAPVALGRWGNTDQSSHPLMSIPELDEGNAWDRYTGVPELQSEPYTKLPANARRAELESNNTRNPAAMFKIPRKQVPSQAYREPLTRSEVPMWPT
ncbi:hypothetical protein BBK36DRAFT_1166460 [Trichoderma citrinoviride]|uniref:Mid2 domain-containing protein n=1 Tax=Trichoderma citrinoviride TaxID=58853 RepID=A0A2T4BGV9_9HYPO|nr:hypothetical protein BBK36DRAFT_1166460 [Trichoderma citrinoviride]PTB68553.1 hypothetical protein BBK36DRAFT_1166460 [Trichoderma citrinoviride]